MCRHADRTVSTHPAAELVGDEARCGGYAAAVIDDGLRLAAAGPDDIDALRALCASWWARHSATAPRQRPCRASPTRRRRTQPAGPSMSGIHGQGSEQRAELDQVETLGGLS